MASEKFEIDAAHSQIDFWVRHMMIAKVRGQFTRWSGTIQMDTDRPEASRVQIQIEAASIDTREPNRDAHLRSADFFDVEKYPTLDFRSTRVERKGSDSWNVVGELTIHGVTREVSVEAQLGGRGRDTKGGERIAFSAKARIDRKDFGLKWNQALEAGGFLVGDAVEIHAEIEATKVERAAQGAAAAAM